MSYEFKLGFRVRTWVGLPHAALGVVGFLNEVLSVNQRKHSGSIALPLQAVAPHGAAV